LQPTSTADGRDAPSQKHKSSESALLPAQPRAGPLVPDMPGSGSPTLRLGAGAAPRWLGRPAGAGTCWLITRQALAAAGGFFAAVTRKSSPRAISSRFACISPPPDRPASTASLPAILPPRLGHHLVTPQPSGKPLRPYPLSSHLHRLPYLVIPDHLWRSSAFCCFPLVTRPDRGFGPQPCLLARLFVRPWPYPLAMPTTAGLFKPDPSENPARGGVLALAAAASYDIGFTHYSLGQTNSAGPLGKARNSASPSCASRPA